MVEAAADAGVERVIYTSILGTGPACTGTFARDHWHTEQRIKASGLRHTFLRDNLYIDLLPLMVGADGVIRGPAGNGRVQRVARLLGRLLGRIRRRPEQPVLPPLQLRT